MNSKAEPVDMHIVAFSDEDLDRLWVCVRHCRRAMESNPESEELAGDLEMLEKTLVEIGR